jgi:uncharacterized protein (TIGR03083 family)
MSTLADRTIVALRNSHDALATIVRGLDDADLDRQSGALEWDVAQVLSHLGSAAEIGLAALDRGALGEPAPGQDFNIEVWDRWNALSQRAKADGFLVWCERFVEAFEELDADARRDLRVQLSFLPFPADVTLLAGMRLNEFAMHSWDVRVAFDPRATLSDEQAAVLLEQYRGPLNFLIGYMAKADAIDGDTVTVSFEGYEPDHVFGLVVGDSVSLGDPHEAPQVRITGPTEAVLRLIAGRLREANTPDSLVVTGDTVTLEHLRAVFPGI